jgi:hypothetical protein
MVARIALLGAVCLFLLSSVAQEKSDKPSTTPKSTAFPQGAITDVGPRISRPEPIFSPGPDYPLSVRKGKHKIQGICVVGLTVDEHGRARDVHVTRSLDRAPRSKRDRSCETVEIQARNEGRQTSRRSHFRRGRVSPELTEGARPKTARSPSSGLSFDSGYVLGRTIMFCGFVMVRGEPEAWPKLVGVNDSCRPLFLPLTSLPTRS